MQHIVTALIFIYLVHRTHIAAPTDISRAIERPVATFGKAAIPRMPQTDAVVIGCELVQYAVLTAVPAQLVIDFVST